jgi:hypothetical protein
MQKICADDGTVTPPPMGPHRQCRQGGGGGSPKRVRSLELGSNS